MIPTLLLAGLLAAPAHAAAPAHPQPETTGDTLTIQLEGLQDLMEGNARFRDGHPDHPHQGLARLEEIAGGQHPFAMVLSCADSRVPPEVVFDQGLGDLFVVRVAGNIAETEGLASMEYAAEHLGVKLLIVLGHEKCGAVAAACALAEGEAHVPEGSNLPGLLQDILPAVQASHHLPGDHVHNAVWANVDTVLHNVEERSPVLAHMIASGEVMAVGAVYDLATGSVVFVNASVTPDGQGFARIRD